MTTTPTSQVQVFVLAHHRPLLLHKTLLSILSQDDREFELIVSDNSTNDSVEKLIEQEFSGQLSYRRRRPALSPIRHFQAVLEESNKDYFVLFHDDDLMQPSFVRHLREFLDQHRECSAVAPNAYLRMDDTLRSRVFYPKAAEVNKVMSGEEMATRYLDLSQFRMPFPGYMYRTTMVAGIQINPEEGGKHADVSFLCKVAGAAPVAWLGKALFEYRIHGGNDSRSESIPSRLSLLRFIYRTSGITRHSRIVGTYRLAYWYLWWRSGIGQGHPWRRSVALRYLIVNALTLPFREPRLVFNILKHRLYYLA